MSNPYKDLIKLIANIEKVTTIGEEFVCDINRYFQLSQEEHLPSKSIKPSSLGGCFRNQWLILQGASQDEGTLEKPEDITIKQSGNDRHERLQNACQDAKNFGIDLIWIDPVDEISRINNMGIRTEIKRKVGNEVLCYNHDYQASFKCDGIILYKGVKYILEIKTEEFMKFNCRVRPEPTHEFQVALYSLCLGIDRVMFLYEERNLTFRKGYEYLVKEDFKQTVKDRIQHILAYDNVGRVPPKDKDKCTYCKYKQSCKRFGNTEYISLEDLLLLQKGGGTNE